MSINYEKDMYIDDDSLDIEILNQPELMVRYAQHAAELRSERDRLKEKLDLVKSQVEKDIRDDPESYDLEKTTDKVVESAVIRTEDYQLTLNEYLSAKYEADVAGGTVSAVDARKTSLELLVKLHGQQYFAGPKIPRDLTSERKKKSEDDKSVNTGISRRLKRKT